MQPKNYFAPKVSCIAVLLLLLRVYAVQAAPYCTPYNGSTFASSGGVNVISDINIPFTGLINSTTNTNSFGYSAFTFSGSNPVFRKGSTYVISATVSSAGDVMAWIDYNQDSTFQSGESINLTISGSSAKGIVTIPATATLGTTRFRIMGAAGSYSVLGPCGNMTQGEAEDYTIDITQATTCALPSILSISDTNSTHSKIKWTGPSGSSYQYIYSTSGSYPIASPVNQSADSLELNGLTPGTKYYIFVRSICGSNDFSDWTTDSFTTYICPVPSIIASQITDSTAVVSWDSSDKAIDYHYTVSVLTTPPTFGVMTNDHTAKITGLKHNTRYCIFVRRSCKYGEISEWASVCISTTNLSVNAIDENISSCYPNPVKDILNVTLLRDGLLTLTDITGRTLFQNESKDKKATINMREFVPGMYFLKCVGEDQSSTLRIIKSAE